MRKLFLFLVTMAFVAVSSFSFANVYASDLDAPGAFDLSGAPITIYYRLNADATTVTVQILDSVPAVVRNIVGGATKGVNSVVWNGKNDLNLYVENGTYTYRVKAEHDGFGSWTQINSILGAMPNVMSCETVDDPAKASFGRTIINVAVDGGGVTQGIYALNADGTWEDLDGPVYAIGAATDARGPCNDVAGISYNTETEATYYVTYASPHQIRKSLATGEDNIIYVSDFQDLYEDLRRFDMDLSASTATNILSKSAMAYHDNSVIGTAIDYGGHRQILSWDEEFNGPDIYHKTSGTYHDLYLYDVDTVNSDYDSTPILMCNASGLGVTDASITRGADLCSNGSETLVAATWSRYTNTAGMLAVFKFKVDAQAADVVMTRTGSEMQTEGGAPSGYYVNWWTDVPSWDNTLFYCGGRYGNFWIYDMSSYSYVTCQDAGPDYYWPAGCVDAVGNVWSFNTRYDDMSVMSPPGANNYTTTGLSSIVCSNKPTRVEDWSIFN